MAVILLSMYRLFFYAGIGMCLLLYTLHVTLVVTRRFVQKPIYTVDRIVRAEDAMAMLLYNIGKWALRYFSFLQPNAFFVEHWIIKITAICKCKFSDEIRLRLCCFCFIVGNV